jgi:hypothetical protein
MQWPTTPCAVSVEKRHQCNGYRNQTMAANVVAAVAKGNQQFLHLYEFYFSGERKLYDV